MLQNRGDDEKARLRVQAVENDCSLKDESGVILCEAVECKSDTRSPADIIRSHFGRDNGVELELPSREPIREPPRFI